MRPRSIEEHPAAVVVGTGPHPLNRVRRAKSQRQRLGQPGQGAIDRISRGSFVQAVAGCSPVPAGDPEFEQGAMAQDPVHLVKRRAVRRAPLDDGVPQLPESGPSADDLGQDGRRFGHAGGVDADAPLQPIEGGAG
jgi:hypothetical protein